MRYLTVDEVIGIHARLLELFRQPSAPLVRRENLEAAVHRPQTAAFYDGASLVRQASSLGLGISQAQAFLDGNKRAAFGALDVFLRLNGRRFVGDPIEIATLLTGLSTAIADRQITMDAAVTELAAWIEPRCVNDRSADNAVAETD